MTKTAVSTDIGQRSDSDLSFETVRASSYDGFTVELRDDERLLIRLHLHDKHGVEELASDLIEVGLTLKRFYEERDWEEFRQMMEEVEQQEERREEERALLREGEAA